MDPKDVGVPSHEGLVLGKHSGRHALKDRLKRLGFSLSEAAIDAAFEQFKDLADKKKEIYDEDLMTIVEDEDRPTKESIALTDLVYTSGSRVAPKVKVVLQYKGKAIIKESTGDGPVDACYRAIEAITKTRAALLDYAIHAVTEGKDAQGEVSVKVEIKGNTYTGRGASTDIIEASAKAYLNAINVALGHK